MQKKGFTTKELTTLAMLTAIAYVLVCTIRIPVVLFLKYEPKDVVITIGGFLLGPGAAMISSVVVSLIEMVTISDTGPIGAIMNFLSTCSFACLASLVYRRKHTQKGAITGLVVGSLTMTAIMLLWNYLVTPLYMGLPREEIAGLLVPAFLPFNLLKAGLNSAITLLLYKPLVTGLRKAGLVSPSGASGASKKFSGAAVVALLVLSTCVVSILVMQGIL